jgi:flagellar biosynthesis component FlhA
MVAFDEIDAGAADCALAIGSGLCCAIPALAVSAPAAVATSRKRMFNTIMEPLLRFKEGRGV